MAIKVKNFKNKKEPEMSKLCFFMTMLFSFMLLLKFGCSSREADMEKAKDEYSKGREAYLRFTPKGLDEAIERYEKAIELDDRNALAYAGLGEAYSFLGMWNERNEVQRDNELFEKSLGYSRKALELDQNSFVTHRALAASYRGLGKFEDARKEALKAIELYPNDAEAYYLLWTVTGADPDSKYIKKALELNPNLSIAYSDLGYIFYAKGNYEKAIENLNRAIELNPELIQAHVNLGLALAADKKLQEAEAEFKKAIKMNPNYLLAHYNLGIILGNQGKFDEAINEFEEAIEINPDFPEPHLALALAYESKGDAQEAIEQYNKFIGLASTDKTKYENIVGEAKNRIKKINTDGS